MLDSSAGAKRVAALTGYLLALLLVAGSVGLYRWDAESFREDAQALLQLQGLGRYVASRNLDEERLQLRQAADRSLARSHPGLHEAMIASRVTLKNHLVLGLDGQAPMSCEEFGNRVFEGKIPSLELPVEVPFALIELQSPWLDGSRELQLEERGTVATLLDRLADAQQPVRMRIARNLDLPPIEGEPCESPDAPVLRASDEQQPSGGVEFKGVELVKDTVIARYEGLPDAQPWEQVALIPQESQVSIAADVDEIEGPPVARLLSDMGQRQLAADLDLLSSRPAALARLRTDYGFLPIDYAVSTAGAALVQGYAGATVLGFRVTPRRLTLVVATVAIGIAAALLLEAYRPAVAGRRLRELAPDGPRAALLASHWGRALLWSVVPPAAIVLAAPWTLPWLIAAALAAVLGAAAAMLAAKADSAAE